MVVDDLDIFGRVLLPMETDAELIIDPDRILTRTVSRQGFQSIARWPSQIRKLLRRGDGFELSSGGGKNLGRKAFWTFGLEDQFGGLVPK